MTKTRKSERALVSIVARYRSPLFFEYVNERCYDLSQGGMFIKSSNPVNPGTLLKLECVVNDGPEKIRGVARVVWVRRADLAQGPAGMGVKFIKLEPGSEKLIERIIEKAGSLSTTADADAAVAQQERPETEPAAQETTERETTPQETTEVESKTADELETEAKARVETVDEISPQLLGVDQLRDISTAEPASATTPLATSEQRSPGFPKWAMAICALALIALYYLSVYDEDESPVSPEQNQQSSNGAEKNRFGKVREAVEPEVEAAPERGASITVPAETEDGTPTAQTLSADPAALEQPRADEAMATQGGYFLTVKTSPPGALVEANGQSIISPGVLKLGNLSSPVSLTARKDNYYTSRVTVDLSIFVRKENALEGLVNLKLDPSPGKPRETQQKLSQEPKASQQKPPLVGSPKTSSAHSSPTPESQAPSASAQLSAAKTRFQIATQCIAEGDNACVIKTLKDKAASEAELGLLIETYRSIGDRDNVVIYVKKYLEKYPTSKRSRIYRKILDSYP
ncbi:MAG: PilZ domain-containing protein [Deltaproteobacteria bacterium]|nr:PilZ domain-containing protein [Deltaproteobacteria bacterium]